MGFLSTWNISKNFGVFGVLSNFGVLEQCKQPCVFQLETCLSTIVFLVRNETSKTSILTNSSNWIVKFISSEPASRFGILTAQSHICQYFCSYCQLVWVRARFQFLCYSSTKYSKFYADYYNTAEFLLTVNDGRRRPIFVFIWTNIAIFYSLLYFLFKNVTSKTPIRSFMLTKVILWP